MNIREFVTEEWIKKVYKNRVLAYVNEFLCNNSAHSYRSNYDELLYLMNLDNVTDEDILSQFNYYSDRTFDFQFKELVFKFYKVENKKVNFASRRTKKKEINSMRKEIETSIKEMVHNKVVDKAIVLAIREILDEKKKLKDSIDVENDFSYSDIIEYLQEFIESPYEDLNKSNFYAYLLGNDNTLFF